MDISVVVFIFSLMIGSFLNVVGLRLMSGEEPVKEPSHCVSCKHRLSFLDMVPVFSWVIMGGKCRYCKEKISYIYPIGELLTAVGFTTIYIKYGFTIEALIHAILIVGLVIATVTDLKEMLVPDQIHVITFIAILFFRLIQGQGQYLLASLGMFSAMYLMLILSRGKMGGADVKIYAPIGLTIGLVKSFESIFYASGVALVVMVAISLLYKKDIKDVPFPFIPFITIGVIMTYWLNVYGSIL